MSQDRRVPWDGIGRARKRGRTRVGGTRVAVRGRRGRCAVRFGSAERADALPAFRSSGGPGWIAGAAGSSGGNVRIA